VSDPPQLLLAHHLKALKLPTFLREYDKLAQQCAAEGIDHPRYSPTSGSSAPILVRSKTGVPSFAVVRASE
jgi:hypothetical protein